MSDVLDTTSGILEIIGQLLDIFGVVDDAQAVVNMASTISVMWTISLAVIVIAAYIYNGLTLMLIGRKAGLSNEWMPFVPFANKIYKLQIVGEQWWKMFFFGIGQWMFWGFLLSLILINIHVVVLTIFLILYTLACVTYYIYYLYLYYKAFNINPLLIIASVALIQPNYFIDVLIGYTNLFHYGENAENTNYAPAAQKNSFQPTPSGGAAGSITCLSGMYGGNTFNMVSDEEMTIGREASECNIVLDQNADKVSRKHVGILYNATNRNYYVTDYSSNGTLTKDGSRLVKNIPTTLPAGTVICLGNNENRFMLN